MKAHWSLSPTARWPVTACGIVAVPRRKAHMRLEPTEAFAKLEAEECCAQCAGIYRGKPEP